MNISRKHLLRITILPVELCIRVTQSMDDPRFVIRSSDETCSQDLRLLRTNDCDYYLLLDEGLAKFGEGRYTVEALDGCDVCDTMELDFAVDCSIKEAKIVASTTTDCEKCDV